MSDETIEEQVEEAAEHAERSVEHHEQERRAEGEAQAKGDDGKRALASEAKAHRESADEEEIESERAADAAAEHRS
jgi:hypothetical protein